MSNLSQGVDTALDFATHIAQSPLLSLVAFAFPQAAPFIAIAKRYAPVIAAAQPAIKAAVEAGQPVFEEAVKAVPKFATVVSQLMHHLPVPSSASAFLPAPRSSIVVENVARALGGFPGMTAEQELKWMNDTTPGGDPSQENSRMGGA